jgi:hypothetical protein
MLQTTSKLLKLFGSLTVYLSAFRCRCSKPPQVFVGMTVYLSASAWRCAKPPLNSSSFLECDVYLAAERCRCSKPPKNTANLCGCTETLQNGLLLGSAYLLRYALAHRDYVGITYALILDPQLQDITTSLSCV